MTGEGRLDDAGEALDLSASAIQRALDATFGLSFHELIERLRLERFLKRLADDPDFKIEAHARDVGWNGKSNLYASIERVTGHSLVSLRDDPALLASVLIKLAGPEPNGHDGPGGEGGGKPPAHAVRRA